jgi:thiol-disulfide isomerase/thioredoxin
MRTIAFFFALVTVGCAPRLTHPLVGKPAPELIAADSLQGEGPKTLAEARGKVVILNFWASFCLSCKEEFEGFQALAQKYPDDLVLLAVSVDPSEQPEGRLYGFLTRAHMKAPVLRSKDPSIFFQRYSFNAIPITFYIDRRGIVRYFTVGGAGTRADWKWITDKVEELLREGGAR